MLLPYMRLELTTEREYPQVSKGLGGTTSKSLKHYHSNFQKEQTFDCFTSAKQEQCPVEG